MAQRIAARSQAQDEPPVTMLACKDVGHFMSGRPIAPKHPFYARLGIQGGSIKGNPLLRRAAAISLPAWQQPS